MLNDHDDVPPRVRRNLIDTAVREFDAHSRDPFARRMLEFSDELFDGHGILRVNHGLFASRSQGKAKSRSA